MSISEFLQFQAFKSTGHGGEEDSLATHGGFPPQVNPPNPHVVAVGHPNNAGATAAAGAAGLPGGLGIHAEQQLEDHQQGMPPLGGGGGGGSENEAHM